MKGAVFHTWTQETPEAKARWFQSLTLAERMDLLCWFTDLALTANPRIMDQKHAEPVAERVQVLTRTRGAVPGHRRHRRHLVRRSPRNV